MKTIRGIYHDLKESEYTFSIGVFKFYFSSKLYRDKFIETYQVEQVRFTRSLNNVYKNHFNIEAEYFAWIRLYTLIEKRGFYLVFKNGVEITCPDDLIFVVTPIYKGKSDESIN